MFGGMSPRVDHVFHLDAASSSSSSFPGTITISPINVEAELGRDFLLSCAEERWMDCGGGGRGGTFPLILVDQVRWIDYFLVVAITLFLNDF